MTYANHRKFGLKKPEGTDIVDIADLNGNMDILDNAVNGKVDKVTGKQLSTNDYTAAEKTKLAGIATERIIMCILITRGML